MNENLTIKVKKQKGLGDLEFWCTRELRIFAERDLDCQSLCFSQRQRESESLESFIFVYLVCHVGENTFIGEHGPG